jgi:hypothetical protein
VLESPGPEERELDVPFKDRETGGEGEKLVEKATSAGATCGRSEVESGCALIEGASSREEA